MKLFNLACSIALLLSACNPAPVGAGSRSFSGGAPASPVNTAGAFTSAAPVKIRPRPNFTGQAFPGFTGRKQFTEKDMKTIVNYENGKVVSVVQVL